MGKLNNSSTCYVLSWASLPLRRHLPSWARQLFTFGITDVLIFDADSFMHQSHVFSSYVFSWHGFSNAEAQVKYVLSCWRLDWSPQLKELMQPRGDHGLALHNATFGRPRPFLGPPSLSLNLQIGCCTPSPSGGGALKIAQKRPVKAFRRPVAQCCSSWKASYVSVSADCRSKSSKSSSLNETLFLITPLCLEWCLM